MHSFFPLLLFLCLLSAGMASAKKVTPEKETVVSTSELTIFLNSGPIVYSDATYTGLESLEKGHADKAYATWVEQGMGGDIEALAMAGMLCRMEEKKPSTGWKVQFGKNGNTPLQPVCPVPAQFWEDSLVTMIGEGEATFLLGLYGMELMDYDPHRKQSDYAPAVEEFMLRSARAGHRDGMYGAYRTGEDRQGKRFLPPKNMPDILVLPEKFEPESTYEQRYWLTHSAHAGNLFAMEGMAWRYRGKPAAVAPNVENVEYYYTMAVENGASDDARILNLLYAKGDILPQDCAKSIYYGAIGVRLIEQGKVILDDEAQYHFGYLLHLYKEGFMKGDLILGGKQVMTKPCLTEAEFEDAVERSKPAYEAAKEARDKDRAQHDALYDAARAKLPEIKAAYEQAIQNNQGKK